MKRIFYLITIICGGAFCAVILWHIMGKNVSILTSVSPIPDFLTFSKNQQVRLLDLWLPFIGGNKSENSFLKPPDVSAKSVLIYDLTNNKTIYEKEAKIHRPMASLTKIMTALVSLDNKRPDNIYLAHEKDLVGEDSMGITVGEMFSLNDLLYGLLLPSGNDAAEVLSNDSPLGRNGFINAMNDKAKALGLIDTHFDNPTGLQGDGVQYTTAYDLLVMTRHALENYPQFATVVKSPEYVISQTDKHKEYDLINETNLLTTYDGVKGVKTGFTPEAGLCLVTYLEYGNHKIIAIILNSEDRRGDMLQLLNYSLQMYGITPPVYRG